MVFLLASCTDGKVRFLVSPHKFVKQIELQEGLAAKREILFNADEFSFLVVKKDKNEKVIPAQHYRAEHTFSNKTHLLKVSWEEPLHISTIVIIDEVDFDTGIAIKLDNDPAWRIYWIASEDLGKLERRRVLYLPSYDKLPFLSVDLIQE